MKRHSERAAAIAACLAFLLCGCAGDIPAAPIESSASDSTAFEQTYTSVQTTSSEDDLPEYAKFFENCEVHDINIEYAEGDWETVKATAAEEKYYPADVTIDGEKFSEVGVRTKGNSSLYVGIGYGLNRFPFHIKFNKYDDNQSFYGLDDLVLNNSTDDPSYLREYLAYDAFRQLGMDVPYVTFFRTYVNGELHGLYVGVECVDSSYLDRTFGGHEGSLYKASVGATLQPQMNLYFLEGKKGAPDDKYDVKEFIDVLNNTPTGEKGELENILDVDSVLKYFAVCAVVHDWDDYCGHFSQNYYLYKTDGVFHIIPWDMNESFLQTQAYFAESDGSQQDIINPVTGDVTLQERPLAEKLLSVPEYYDKYLSYCEILADWLDDVSENQIPELKMLIYVDAINDPTSFFTDERIQKQFMPEFTYGLAGFVKKRAEYLDKRIPELKELS